LRRKLMGREIRNARPIRRRPVGIRGAGVFGSELVIKKNKKSGNECRLLARGPCNRCELFTKTQKARNLALAVGANNQICRTVRAAGDSSRGARWGKLDWNAGEPDMGTASRARSSAAGWRKESRLFGFCQKQMKHALPVEKNRGRPVARPAAPLLVSLDAMDRASPGEKFRSGGFFGLHRNARMGE